MVRLEKVVYEQLVNSTTFNRARKISSPRKWFTTNPYEHMSRIVSNNISSGI